LAGVGGSFLSLYYPGSWNEALNSGQGLMAVALVILRDGTRSAACMRRCSWRAKALGPALQSVGISNGHYLFDALRNILTLVIMCISCSPKRALVGAPGELGKQRHKRDGGGP